MDKNTDRRIIPRIPAIFSLRFLNTLSNKWTLAKTQNICEHGIGIETDHEIKPETPLEMWLPIPGKGETFYTRGKVAWSQITTSNRYKMGIEINDGDPLGMMKFIWKYMLSSSRNYAA